MRAIGLALLLVGYLWLVWDQFSINPLLRMAVDQAGEIEVLIPGVMHQVPLRSLPDTSYSIRNDQAKGLPFAGVRMFHDKLPDFLWSGTTMLGGGLLLALRGGRRKATRTSVKS